MYTCLYASDRSKRKVWLFEKAKGWEGEREVDHPRCSFRLISSSKLTLYSGLRSNRPHPHVGWPLSYISLESARKQKTYRTIRVLIHHLHGTTLGITPSLYLKVWVIRGIDNKWHIRGKVSGTTNGTISSTPNGMTSTWYTHIDENRHVFLSSHEYHTDWRIFQEMYILSNRFKGIARFINNVKYLGRNEDSVPEKYESSCHNCKLWFQESSSIQLWHRCARVCVVVMGWRRLGTVIHKRNDWKNGVSYPPFCYHISITWIIISEREFEICQINKNELRSGNYLLLMILFKQWNDCLVGIIQEKAAVTLGTQRNHRKLCWKIGHSLGWVGTIF